MRWRNLVPEALFALAQGSVKEEFMGLERQLQGHLTGTRSLRSAGTQACPCFAIAAGIDSFLAKLQIAHCRRTGICGLQSKHGTPTFLVNRTLHYCNGQQ